MFSFSIIKEVILFIIIHSLPSFSVRIFLRGLGGIGKLLRSNTLRSSAKGIESVADSLGRALKLRDLRAESGDNTVDNIRQFAYNTRVSFLSYFFLTDITFDCTVLSPLTKGEGGRS